MTLVIKALIYFISSLVPNKHFPTFRAIWNVSRHRISTVNSHSFFFPRLAPLIGRWCAEDSLPEVERESWSTPWEKHGSDLIRQNGRLKDSLIDRFATRFRPMFRIVMGIWNENPCIFGWWHSETS